jgi:site-specific recombinase XerD
MKNSLSYKFYLNISKEKDGKFPIYLRLLYNRQKAEICTDYRVNAKDWDESKQRIKKTSSIVNQGLIKIENKIFEALKKLQSEENGTVTIQELKDNLTGKDQIVYTLFDFCERFMTNMRKAGEVEKHTLTKYSGTIGYVKDFVKAELGKKDLQLVRVNHTFLKGLDIYLLNVMVVDNDERKVKMSRNTVNKHHSRFRTILISAYKENIIPKNPYRDFTLRNTPSNRSFLSQDELDALIKNDFGGNGSLKKVRDLFLFSVYTGLRFEDAQNLKIHQVKHNSAGDSYLEVVQEKTKEKVQIPLLKEAIVIIDRYRNVEQEITGNVLPKISNQKVNTYLKVIAQLSGIQKTLTHHVARHTCATTILLNNEIPLEAVSKWLGHNNIRTTQIYAKITNDYLMKLGKKLDNKISH